MIEFKDYYKILGLKTNASIADIKSAFKKLAKQYHPDAKEGSEERFKEINEAYEVLKDKEKRNKYDLMYNYQSSINNPHSETFRRRAKKSPLGDFEDYMNMSNRSQSRSPDSSFSDFFEMLFGHYQKQASNKRNSYDPPQRGDDYEMELELSLEEAFHGTTRKIEITGSNKTTRRIEVNIPAHVNEDNKIKIAGEGKTSKNGGGNGDLYLKIKFKKHDHWHIEDKFNIHQDLVIEPYEAVLGTVKTIVTLTGKIDLTIPPKTKAKKVLRIKEKGLKDTKQNKFGDHLIHIVIDIPEEISDEEKKLYEELSKIKKKNI